MTTARVEGPGGQAFAHRSLRDIFVENLREQILTRQLAAGTKLDVTSIAESYSVSQGPVREALIVLESEGLVVTKPRRGKFVRSLTSADLLEIYAVREIIDIAAASILAQRADPDAIATLRVVCAKIHDTWDEGDFHAGIEADLAFHITLAELTGNSRLVAVSTNMAHQTMMHLAPIEATSQVIRQQPPSSLHGDIVDAIAAGHEADVASMIRAHYDFSRARLSQYGVG